jgi:hypothetical protein
MIYSKTLDIADYEWLPTDYVSNTRDMLVDEGTMARFEHEHRAWEYALAIHALENYGARRVVDVGGGASVFAPAFMLRHLSNSVFQVDPGIEMHWLPDQERATGLTLNHASTSLDEYVAVQREHSLGRYEAVVSLSTIEHVIDDYEFFGQLCQLAKDKALLIVTFDYHPSGEQRLQGHLRTYNNERIALLMGIGMRHGFQVYGDGVDYTWRGPAVNDYTFGSLVMERDNGNG